MLGSIPSNPAAASIAAASAVAPGLLEIRNVTKTFDVGTDRLKVLDDVSLGVSAGAFVAVVGPSGSGKSTLLHLVAGFDRPDSGEITIGGRRVDRLRRPELDRLRSRELGFVFQDFSLLPVLNAVENVEMGIMAWALSRADRRAMAMAALDQVGLADRARHRPSQLSGGQKQRVAVARAICSRPQLVLADEPTASLDSHSALDLIELMLRLGEEDGTAFLFATHDQRLIDRAPRILRLVDGSIG